MHLWNRYFWLLIVANLLLSMSITMLIPTLPQWLLCVEGFSAAETGVIMGVFAVGLFLPGMFCSYLVQRYRRNMVCVWSILLLALSFLFPHYINVKGLLSLAIAGRLLQGMAFGLALMVLTSTLVIETCESFQRTEANHSATWFGRFALSIGPVVGIIIEKTAGFQYIMWTCVVFSLLAAALILMVHFPFRVPSDHVKPLSLDRFLLLSGWPLLLHLFVITLSIGMLLSLPFDESFYGMLMTGFLLALLAQRFVFPNAELKSETVSGLILIGASILIALTSPTSVLLSPLLGFGTGVVGSRFLLFFIKHSRHCQRGTAQSTFILGWESGLAVGVGLGYCFFADNRHGLLLTSLSLIALTLVSYVVILHRWFMTHRNR